MRRYILLLAVAVTLAAGGGESAAATLRTWTKQVKFPANASESQKLEMAANLIPTDGQLAWQNLELTAFLHFGVNTFTSREWGDGTESPDVFNPANLDADQWVSTLKKAGFKMVILTAKHHDGFCLWPTKTTGHSVASSKWKNGKGDVVRELRTACDKHGMKLGLYLSPWDRNAACYGDSPKYNDFFVRQLTELLTEYGKVDEVWFDGACGEGPNGKKQVYDWTRFMSVIKNLQPDAVTAIMGDDVRWVGNEKGQGRETEWSATVLTPGVYAEAETQNKELGITGLGKDLGSREMVAKAKALYWYPSEVDVSIRPGWFYHEKESAKSLPELVDIYFNSVGRNSVLLMNIPPDTDGRINKNDSTRLMELHQYVKANLANSLVAGTVRPVRIKSMGAKTFKLQGSSLVNCVMLQEDVSKGQRVEQFEISALNGGVWKKIAEGTTVGYKRLLRFDECRAEALKLTIVSSRGTANVKNFAAYKILPARNTAAGQAVKTMKRNRWDVVEADNENELPLAIDGNPKTAWNSTHGDYPKSIVVDLGGLQSFAGFRYTPCTGEQGGLIFKYRVSVSDNAAEWTDCTTSGEFSNIGNNPIPQDVYFAQPVKARYLKLDILSEYSGKDYVTVGEFDVLQ